ncbi:MAG: asparaginase [Bacteriovoracaceae bacterium]|jgi:L-asparaginase|nr:asparaginase [Bacteriovoracaceae bacterium]
MTSNEKTELLFLTTGGTIEKTYDEGQGTLENRESAIRKWILSSLRLPYTQIKVRSILSKDSLQMDDKDRDKIYKAIKKYSAHKIPIVVLHGTDTLENTLEYCIQKMGKVEVPVVFTGAMRPLEFVDSDAKQNITEAMMVAKIIDPGFYLSFHGKLFCGTRVRKNRDLLTFEEK